MAKRNKCKWLDTTPCNRCWGGNVTISGSTPWRRFHAGQSTDVIGERRWRWKTLGEKSWWINSFNKSFKNVVLKMVLPVQYSEVLNSNMTERYIRIMAVGDNVIETTEKLQAAIVEMEKWTNNWRIKLNELPISPTRLDINMYISIIMLFPVEIRLNKWA